jgi:adenosylhomocysteine nucleosidase
MSKVKSDQIIGILGAMPEEIVLIQSESKNVVTHKINEFITLYEGELENKKIVFGISGVGKTFASSVVTTMIHKFNITSLIFTGIAGGLRKFLIFFQKQCQNHLV